MTKAVTTRSAPYGKALKASIQENGPEFIEAEVAAIGVMDGDKILMGRRRDSGRWTLPGGHLEDDEDPHDGALRELAEETGIKAHSLNYLGSQGVISELGKAIMVHAFHLTAQPNATVTADPDQEVVRWRWIDCSRGLPAHIASNLHSKRNVVLMFLDIYRSFGSGLYIDDLIKSRSHKYLRKYKGRNGEWIYVYHEGEAHGRVVTPEAVGHLKDLAEMGHHESKQLMDTVEAHNEEKLKHLRELSDMGHDPATEHLKHLGIDRGAEKAGEEKEKAKAKAKAKAEEAERLLLGDNTLTKPLTGEDSTEFNRAINGIVKQDVFTYLAGHQSTPIGQVVARSGLTLGSVTAGTTSGSIQDRLDGLHAGLKKLDKAIGGLTSARSEVSAAGGYGNMVYNKIIGHMIQEGYLPEEARSHKRTSANQGGDHKLPVADLRQASRGLDTRRSNERSNAAKRVKRETRESATRRKREFAERAERARVETETREAEARALDAELGGSMAQFMSTITDQRMTPETARNLHRELKSIFGGNGLTKEQWPYDFSAHGMKTKITSISVGRGNVRMRMQIYDAQGNEMMGNWERTWSKQNGRPHIENNYMEVRPTARTGVQIGNLINQGQRKLMRSIPGGGVVRVHANIDVGGYTWCNQGFSFSASDLRDRRRNFQYAAAGKGVVLTDDDMALFKDAHHFAAFDDGKKYINTLRSSVSLSQKQIETKSLTGVSGEHPLTDDEISSKKAYRMACHLGKSIMLGTNWYGDWDSAKNTEASKFADKYYELRDRATEMLSPEFKALMSSAKAGGRGRGMTDEAPRPLTRRSDLSSSATPQRSTEDLLSIFNHDPQPSAHVRRYLNFWASRGTGKIMVTPARLRTMSSWSTENLRDFLQHAGPKMTRPGKQKIREMLSRRT